MSMTINTASTAAASPLLNAHAHGHKKGVHGTDSDADSGGASTGRAPAATQNLFDKLFQTAAQLIGVSGLTARPATAAVTAATGAGAAAAATGAGTAAPGVQSSGMLGTAINAHA